FKLVAGRPPDGDDLASQPTLSRFENAISIASLKRLRDLFIDQFIAAFPRPPRRLTLDLDAVDDPAHGRQQLTFWHGFYDQNQYLPLVITCADNDQLVLLSLRPGNVHAALGADDDLAHLVRRLRQVWPDVELLIRGDAGFGVPWMYDACEARDLRYTFGLAANKVLQRRSEPLLTEAVRCFEQTGAPQRLFDGVSGRSKPATDGRLKTSHFEEADRDRVTSQAYSALREVCHVESAQSGHDRDHPVPVAARLVPAPHRPRAGHQPRDRRTPAAARSGAGKTGHCAPRLPGCGGQSKTGHCAHRVEQRRSCDHAGAGRPGTAGPRTPQ